MGGSSLLWTIFIAGVGSMVAFDLLVLQRRAHTVSPREAVLTVGAWVALALAFCGCIWAQLGDRKALEFLTGYILEQSLSVDNMFVFLLIFKYFDVPDDRQGRVLHWGILGAVVMRLIFIAAGIGLIRAFHWMIYLFGALLIYTGIKMWRESGAEHDPRDNFALKVLKRILPLSDTPSERFFTRVKGVLHATPLFAALVVVEFSDVVFALDSIPAILAVTPDPFIVYTSNVFAVMGLRSLYFLLAWMSGAFRYLSVGISAVLVFVGAKMLVSGWWHVPIGVSLAVIGALLGGSMLASVAIKPARPAGEAA